MQDLEKFELCLKEAVGSLNSIDKAETLRVISHLDSDGICAASLLLKAFNLDKRKYSLSIVQQLDEKVVKELAEESYKYIFFTDIGAGQLDIINRHLGDRSIFILDHHEPIEPAGANIVHVNPHLFGINGSNEISGAGVVYMFVETLNPKLQEFAHIALIGAIGDIQDELGFSILNQNIIAKAVAQGKVKIIKGLKLFGAQTKPLHKILEYSSSPAIPGVSGSESGAIQFLRQIGIEPKEGNQWRKLVNLNPHEIERLTDGIIMKLLESDTPVNPEEIIGEIYILREEEKESPLREAKEFSTMLNACGRMGKASVGIGACLGDPGSKIQAMSVLGDYKKEIVKALEWYDQHKKLSQSVISEKGFLIINAKDRIKPSIIGTLASIISKSNDIRPGTFVLSMAQNDDGNTKVSVRIAGNNNCDVDLNSIVGQITEKLGFGKGGGHAHASGAVIPTDKEEEFITQAKLTLSQIHMEEKIL